MSLRSCAFLSLSLGISFLAGCSGGSSSLGTPINSTSPTIPALASGGAKIVTVATATSGNNFSTSVWQLPAGSNGVTQPSLSFTAGLVYATALTSDSSGNLYLGGGGYGFCGIFIAPPSSTYAPSRTITTGTSSSNCTSPSAIALDTLGSIYGAYTQSSGTSIVSYGSAATGQATPATTLTGSATGFTSSTFLNDIALDSSRNLYVSFFTTPGLIEVFAPGATGNTAPTRTISLPSGSAGIAIGPSGELYVAQGDHISVYAANASGSATPVRTITPTAANYLLAGVRIDKVGNLYVPALLSGTTNYVLLEMPPTASGTTPLTIVTSTSGWTGTTAVTEVALN